MTEETPILLYYAIVSADADLSKPVRVLGWDQYPQGTDLSDKCPPDERLVQLDMTEAEWSARPLVNPMLADGKIYEGISPSLNLPLQDLAQDQMQKVRQVIQRTGWGTFEPMPADVAAYGKALGAIADGSDTTSTTLPPVPDDLAKLMPA